MKEKNKKIFVIGIIVFILILLISAGTYAYWTWVTAENERTNVTLSIEAPDMSARLTGYTQNITNLIPVSSCTDPQYAIKKELTLTYENLSTNTGAILGTLSIEEDSFISPYGTPDANDLSHLHYAVTKSPDNCTAEPLEGMSGTFTETSGNLFTSQLLAGPIPTGTESESQTYYLWVWLDSEYTHQNVGSEITNDPMQNISFTLVWEGEIKNDKYEFTGVDGQFKYLVLDSGKIQITRYIGESTNVTIPAIYDGYQVYSVGNPDATSAKTARYNIFGETNSTSNTTIKSIAFEEGIEKIELGAFSGCTGLSNNGLVFPSSVKEIGGFAFNGCSGLKGDLNLPEGLVKLGDAVFQSCGGFNGILMLPDSLEEIGTSVFNHCNNFTNTTLHIPKNLRVIGRDYGYSTHTFYNFAAKTFVEFTIDNDQQYYKVVDGVLFSKDGTRLLSYPQNKVIYDAEGNVNRTYEIPEGVTRLDEMAFNRAGHASYSSTGSTGLQKLLLPNSLIMNTDVPDCFLNVGSELAVALYTYTGVNEIAVKDDNPNYKTDNGILYSKDGTVLWYVPMAKEGAVTILDGVITIEEGAFFTGGKLTSVALPASLSVFKGDMLDRMNYYLKNKMTIDSNNTVYQITNGIITLKS